MKKIGIIGLGLIGASLLKSLQDKGLYLVAISSNPDTLKKIENQNLAQRISQDITDVSDCDVVFICTPISTITAMLEKLSKIITKKTIVTDVASVKGFICEYSKTLDINFIGSHPMAGTENKGFDSSDSNLFDKAKWVLTPDSSSCEKDIKILKNIISKTGAQTIIMDSKIHDEAVALISHVPMIMAQGLFYMLSNYEREDIKDAAKKLASSGFRDMTRLACSNSQMALDMVEYNKENIYSVMNRYSHYTKNLMDNYSKDLLEILTDERKNMYSKEGKNVY